MATGQHSKQNRYHTMRSAILTGSLLSILPLVILMKNAAPGDASGSVALAASAQGIGVAADPTQTTGRQAAATPVTGASSTSSSTNTASALTYTRTKAS